MWGPSLATFHRQEYSRSWASEGSHYSTGPETRNLDTDRRTSVNGSAKTLPRRPCSSLTLPCAIRLRKVFPDRSVSGTSQGMERTANKARNWRQAADWDIRQNVELSPQERQRIARELKRRCYGLVSPDVRACHRKA